jgi:hypothetical protein
MWYQNIKTRVEEVAECFRVADPENNQLRPNAPDFNKPVVADVLFITITCPIPVAASAPLSLCSAARKPGRTAQIARTGRERNQI